MISESQQGAKDPVGNEAEVGPASGICDAGHEEAAEPPRKCVTRNQPQLEISKVSSRRCMSRGLEGDRWTKASGGCRKRAELSGRGLPLTRSELFGGTKGTHEGPEGGCPGFLLSPARHSHQALAVDCLPLRKVSPPGLRPGPLLGVVLPN